MRKNYLFTDYLPDLADNGEHLTIADGAFPIANGFAPVGSPMSATDALPEDYKGGASFVGSGGSAALLAGSSNKLYRYSGLEWTAVMVALSAGRWDFTQFGDLVIGVYGGTPVKFDLEGGTAGFLGGSPPNAAMCATVREGFVFTAGEAGNEHTVNWSAFNNAEGWTFGVGGAGFKELFAGGRVTGLAGGEYAIVLQENRVVRASEAGEGSFQFDPISENVGCMTSASVGQEGRMVFFISERGFMMTDGNTVAPIGNEKINRSFFSQYSRDDIINSVSCSVDPRNSRVFWAMPDKIWVFNWELQKWSTITVQNKGVLAGFSANISLEAIAALYPGGLETIPYSLDDGRFSGGVPRLYVMKLDNVFYTLSGENMKATFELAEQDMAGGISARFRRARPISDAQSFTLTMRGGQARAALDKQAKFTEYRKSGDMPIRFRARHIKPKLEITAGAKWSHVRGIEFEFSAGGRQ